MIKLVRIVRLQKIINFLTTTDDVKASLKLLKTVFMLVFYIHLTGCLWFYIGKPDRAWIPMQFSYYGRETSIYDEDTYTMWLVSAYNAVLTLVGSDIGPKNNTQFMI